MRKNPDDSFVWIDRPRQTQQLAVPQHPRAVWLTLNVEPSAPPTSKRFDPQTGEVVGERPFSPAHEVNALLQEGGHDWAWHDGVLTLADAGVPQCRAAHDTRCLAVLAV